MSGPKVMRIVTREEVEAICRRHIAAVKAAALEFIRRAKRCGVFDEALGKAAAGSIAALEALVARNEWLAVQKQGPETIVFLAAEGDRVERVATEQEAKRRGQRRRTMDAARTIASALQAAGLPVSAALELAAEGRSASQDEADQAVAVGLAAIPGKRPAEMDTAGQAELATRLGTGESGRTINDLVVGRRPEASPDEIRLDTLLAELHVLGDEAAEFIRRVDAVSAEPEPARRRLLTDSLVMDAAARVTVVRKRVVTDSRLRQAAASLEGADVPDTAALRTKLDAAVGRADEAVASGLVAEVDTLITAHARVQAATARRRAILSGLSSLGYEIREGMGSAWERDGRIVVRKPGATDYGVEVGAPIDAARFQVRLVGSAAPEMPRDRKRDADQEVMWCGEFDRLREGLGAHGDHILVEKAVEAGTVPLRSVDMPRVAERETSRDLRPTVGKRLL